MAKKKDYGTGIPQHEIEALARCLLPEIIKFFESEEGTREFEDWKAEQVAKKGGIRCGLKNRSLGQGRRIKMLPL